MNTNLKTSTVSWLLMIFLFCPITMLAQTININGQNVVAEKKSQINPKVDFYQVKDTASAKLRNYIKTNDSISPTIFSEAELRTFINTGKIANLGVVKKSKGIDSTTTYIQKKDFIICFIAKGNSYTFWEFPSEAVKLFENKPPSAAKKAGSGMTSGSSGSGAAMSRQEALIKCLDGCEDTYISCRQMSFGHSYCYDVYKTCCEICIYNYTPRSSIGKTNGHRPDPIKEYRTSKYTLEVKSQ